MSAPSRRGRRRPGATLAWAGVPALAAAAACAPGPQPCVSPGTCPAGEECLANRCVRAAGGAPVSATSRRVVLAPVELAWLREGEAPRGLPLAVTLGRAGAAREALLLRFPSAARAGGELEAAFLVLDPVVGEPEAADVAVRVARVIEPWRAGDVSWREAPRAGLPAVSGIARTSPPLPLRVDVTALVRRLRSDPRGDHGLVLRAVDETPGGASYALGTGIGRAPRLELYLR